MHSTFIIAAFALCAIAAPIPEADPIFKGNDGSCIHRGSLLICPTKRAIDLESHAKIHANIEDVETRAIRNEGRSPALSRPKKGSRDSEHAEVKTHELEKKGAVRGQRRAAEPVNRSTKSSRSLETVDEENDDFQTESAVREPGKGRPTHPRAEADVHDESDSGSQEPVHSTNARGVRGSNKRYAAAEPVFRAGSGK